jgi:hypothetical protein
MRKLSTLVASVIFMLCASAALAQPLEEPLLDRSAACLDLFVAYRNFMKDLLSPPNLGELIARCNKAPSTCRHTRKELNIGVHAAESITPWGELNVICAPPACRHAESITPWGELNVICAPPTCRHERNKERADAAESIKRRLAAELICYDRE